MAPGDLLDGMDESVSHDDHTQCIDLLLESDDVMFEGVVPFVGGGAMTRFFAPKEEPSSSDDELDSFIPPLPEENPDDAVACKRGPGYVGAYSPAERRARIARFHAKRARRVWKKRVRYDARKSIACKRVRVKGRFVKKEEESLMKGRGEAEAETALSSEPSSDDDGAGAHDFDALDDDAVLGGGASLDVALGRALDALS